MFGPIDILSSRAQVLVMVWRDHDKWGDMDNLTVFTEFLIDVKSSLELQILEGVLSPVIYLGALTGNLVTVTVNMTDTNLHSPMYIFTIFLMALITNRAMIFLIHRDPLLHTPMYFLLSQLSFINVMYISTIVPKALVDYLLGWTISFSGCVAQYFLYMGFVGAEFFLLGLIAYDLYVAICSPLSCPVLMDSRVCLLILASSWFGGALGSFLLTPLTMSLPFCASHTINNLFWEALTMLRLACDDKASCEKVMYMCCVLMLLVPFLVETESYTHILLTMCCMKSAKEKKAFPTCSSHMTVLMLFYGAALYTYMLPQSYHTPLQDKVPSIFYIILTPMMNLLIYSLRNRDMREAWDRLLARR
ncbi:Olfactory receptor 2T6 [Heterocephalus glaber]|uniref:Olfactory receptor 2T6 n=1 Tax=Heterocephalus glaber TaxID=10181 RepID=G5B074_HETGA|nr:Olfactory receptor 2T6 [Heterocephalus glaber]